MLQPMTCGLVSPPYHHFLIVVGGTRHHVKELLPLVRRANIDFNFFLKKEIVHQYLLPCCPQGNPPVLLLIHIHSKAYPQFKIIQHPFLKEIHTGGAKEKDRKNLAGPIKI
jgi:hypothetical protein